jgi:protein-S-isoprenylcysteine O-methyltransferase Ste14
MMVRLGNFLFHFRNGLFPAFYLLLFLNSPRIFDDYWLAVALGLTLALAGQVLRALTIGLAYIVRGGKDRQVYARNLVVEGIFAHCRNPLYVGNFLILCGLAFAANSFWFMIAGIPLFALAYAAIIAAEENYLREKFGTEYSDYCARVNRFVPKLAGLAETLQSMEFKWRRLLVKEYGSAYAWMAGMILVVLKNIWLGGLAAKNGPLFLALEASLALLTVAYLCVRYLKKRRIVIAD